MSFFWLKQCVTSKFVKDIKDKIEISYQKPSKLHIIQVKEYQIPTIIFEEAQGNALIRTLQFHESNIEDKLKPMQETVRNFFNMITTNLPQTEIAWETRKIIASLICYRAKQIPG